MRELSDPSAVLIEQCALLSSLTPPRRTRADVPLTALNCIVVFSAMKVDKMVPPVPPRSNAQPLQRPRQTGGSRDASASIASVLRCWSWLGVRGRQRRLLAQIAGRGIGCAPQVLGSLLFSCIMVGNKMLVAINVIRLRNRRVELATVLRHMRMRSTTAQRELMPIQPVHEADSTISEV